MKAQLLTWARSSCFSAVTAVELLLSGLQPSVRQTMLERLAAKYQNIIVHFGASPQTISKSERLCAKTFHDLEK